MIGFARGESSRRISTFSSGVEMLIYPSSYSDQHKLLPCHRHGSS